jgi:serine/threonine protein kinase
MSHLFHCPQGHCWDEPINADAPTTDNNPELARPICPVCGRSPEIDMSVLPGYEVLHRLGEGGMGQVYKARHLRLDRIVALKVIRPALVAHAEALQRFHREAKDMVKNNFLDSFLLHRLP